MRITNRSVILIIRDGEMLRANVIAKKIEKSLVALKAMIKGKAVPKIFLECAKEDLEYLRHAVLFIEKAGA